MLVDYRRGLLAGTAAHGLLAFASAAAFGQALPQGGQVIGGQAQIHQISATSLSIVQTTDRAAIAWQSFSIGQGASVDIRQPNASSISLNEVVGTSPSQIFGSLTSNGRVVLANPNGIWFGPTAQVDVASIVATTAYPTAASVAGFIAGGSLDLGLAGAANASVVNQGTVTVAAAGLAAFVAPGVANSGVIAARLGTVRLASGTTGTIDFRGDGLINFAVTGQTLARALGPDGKPLAAAVASGGTIAADGGRVLVTADVAKNVVDDAINMSGVTQARAVSMAGGEIVLNGGSSGTVAVSGTLDASGQGASQTGGTVKVLGNDVALGGGARLDASGGAGGGTVLVGGNFHGAGPELNAATTTISEGARLRADATSTGAGGAVAIWSDGATRFDGSASANGVGAGGFIETSGKATLAVGADASISVASPHGQAGIWLLDPSSLTISTTSGSITSVTSGGTTTISSTATTGATATAVAASVIDAALAANNVVVTTANAGQSQSGDITVGSNITWNSANTLTLRADRSITISAGSGITDANTAGALVLSAGNTTTTGSITVSSPLNGGSINLTTGAAGFITIGAAISATTLTTSAPVGVTFNLGSGTAVTTSGGGQTYQNPVRQTATTTLADTGGGSIVFGGTINGASALTVNTSGTTSFGGSIGATTALASLTTDAPGTVSLGPGVGTVRAAGIAFNDAVSLGGDTTLTTTSNHTITLGQVSGGGDTLSLSTGTGAVTANGMTLAGLVISGTGKDILNTGTYTFGSGAFTFANATTLSGSLTFSQGTTFGGAVTLGGDTTVDAASNPVTFASTVNGAHGLTVNSSDATSFASSIGNTAQLTALTTDAPGSLSLGALTAKVSGALSFGEPLTLGGNVTLNTSAGNGTVTLNSVSGAGDTLSLTTGSGAITLNGLTVKALPITTTGAETINPGTYTVTNGVSFTSTGGETISGTVTLSQATTIGSATSSVTLGGDTTIVDTNNAVTLGAVQGSGDSLLLSTGTGAIALNGFSLAAVSIASTRGVTLNAGTYNLGSGAFSLANAVTLSGALTFGQDTSFTGAVTIAGTNTSLTTASNAVTLGTVAGAGDTLSLSTGSGAITLNGVAVKAMPITTSGLETLDAGTYTVTGAYTFVSSGGQAVSGALTFGQATTFAGPVNLIGNATLATTGNSALTFGAISGSGDTLSLSTGSGLVTLNGLTVQALAVTGTGGQNLAAGTYAISGGAFTFPNASALSGSLTFSQGMTFGGAVTLGADTIVDAGANAVTFAGTVNGAHALTVNSAAATSFAGSIGATTRLASLTTDAAGTLALGAITAAVSGPLSFGDPITLGGNTTINTSTGNGTVTLNTVSGASRTLSLSTGTGVVTLNGLTVQALALGGTGGQTLDPGTYAISAGAFTFPNASTLAGSLTFSQGTTFGGAVTLGADTIVNAGANLVKFSSTVNGAHALTVNSAGATSLAGSVGTATPLSSLATDAPGTLALGAITVTLNGPLSFGDPLTLGGNVTLNTSAGNGTVALNTVSGAGDTLSLSTGSGAILLNGVNVKALPIATTGAETLNPGIYTVTNGAAFTSIGGEFVSGALTFGQATAIGSTASPVTLGGDTTILNNNTLTLGPVLGSGDTLSLSTGTGAITLNGVSVAALAITTTGAETLNAGSYTIAGGSHTFASSGGLMLSGTLTLGQATTFGGPVTLVGDTTLVSADAAIVLGTVSGAGDALSLSTDAGAVTLNGVSVQALSITTTGGEILHAGTYSIGSGGITFASSGGETLGGLLTFGQPTSFASPVTLDGDTTLSTTNQPITLGMVTGGFNALSLTTGAGAVTLNGVSVQSLSITTTGGETLNAGAYTATLGALSFGGSGGQTLSGTLTFGQPTTFTGPVTLGGDTTLATANGALTLGPVSGSGDTLALTTGAGGITLNGVTVAALSITSSGAETLNAGTYNISGGAYTFASSGGETLSGTLVLGQATTFGGAVTLAGDVALVSTDTAIVLGPVSGSGDTLSLSTGVGAITLNGLMVAALPIATTGLETLGAGTYDIGGGSYTFASSGGETVSGALTFGQATSFATAASLAGDTTIAATGSVTFAAGLSGTNALTVTGGATTLDGTVAVGSLSLQAATLAGTVTTSAGQSYSAVTLAADTSLDDTASSTIALNATVDGAFALSVNTAGQAKFGGAVGGTTSLASLIVANGAGTTSLDGGSAATSGAQTYVNPVTLGVDTVLTASTVDFASIVNSAGAAVSLAITGGASFGAAVGGLSPLASLGVSGASSLAGNVATAGGGQNYGGAVTLAGDATLGESGGGAIAFAAAVDGARNLKVDSSGAATFGGAVGAVTALASLTVANGAGTTVLNGGSVATTGAETFDNPVTLGAATVLTATTVDFASSVNSAGGTVALAITGGASFGAAVGGLSKLASLTVSGATTLDGDVATAGGGQSYGGAVTLGADATLSDSLGAAISFASTVGGAQALKLDTSGTASLAGSVQIASLTVTNAAGTTVLDGGSVGTTGGQVYGNPVTLGAATTLSASTISFATAVNSSGAAVPLTVSGNVSFGGTVGGSTPLQSLVVTGSAVLDGSVTTAAGGQSYAGAVTLVADAALTDTGGGAVAFAGAVDGSHLLIVDTAGEASFGGMVGATTALASLTIANGAGSSLLDGGLMRTDGAQRYGNPVTLGAATTLDSSMVTFAATVNSAGTAVALTVSGGASFGAAVGAATPLASLVVTGVATLAGDVSTASGGQEYGGAVTLAGDAALADTGGGAITFGSAIDGVAALTIDSAGLTSFGGSIGATTPLASLAFANGAGSVTFGAAGGTVATTGGQSYAGAVSLAATTRFVAASVTFDGAVTGSGTLDTTAIGLTTFDSAVTVASVDAGATQIDGGTITTSGHQTYGAIVLGSGGATLADSAGGAITFTSTIDGAGNLTTNTTGATTFEGVVGGTTALGVLIVDGPTVFDIPVAATNAAGFSVRATDTSTGLSVAGPLNGFYMSQAYLGSVTLVTDATLTNSVGFGGTVDAAVVGGAGLTVTSFANFIQPVGGVTPLSKLVTGDTNSYGSITTAGGGQSYTSLQLIGTTMTLSDTRGGNIIFGANSLGSLATDLTISTGGNIDFGGPSTYVHNMTISATGGTTVIDLPGFFADLSVLFGNPVLLGADTTFFDHTVNFGSSVDLAGTPVSLTVNSAASFGAAVGGMTPLASLDVTGKATLAGDVRTAGGGQVYSGALTLGGDAILADSAGGAIKFFGAIDGAHALTVATAGDVTLANIVGLRTPLVSLIAGEAGGRIVLDANIIATTGSQTYTSDVVLSRDLRFSASSITFDGTVTGLRSSLIVTRGTTTFEGDVEVGSLSLQSATFAPNVGSIVGQSGQAYAGALTLSGDVTLYANFDALFASTVDGAHNLTIFSNAASFGGSVGATTPLASLTLFNSGTATFSGGSVTTTGDQTYTGLLKLAATETFAAPGHAILFEGPVHGATLVATAGTVTLGEVELAGISIAGTEVLDGGIWIIGNASDTYTFPGPIVLNGNLSLGQPAIFGGAVTLTADSEITSDNTTEFQARVDGAFDLTLNSNGTTIFDAPIGRVTPLTSFTVVNPSLAEGGDGGDGGGVGIVITGVTGGGGVTIADPPGEVVLIGGSVTTTGVQDYQGQVLLGANTILQGSTVVFESTVDALAGPVSLAVSGDAYLGAPIGAAGPLASLGISGAATIGAGAVITTGAQTYGGAVVVDADSTMTSTGGGTLSFGGPVDAVSDGSAGFAVTTAGSTIFSAAVGGATPLASLGTAGGGSATFHDVTTAGAQSFANSQVTLDGTYTTNDLTLQAPGAVTLTGSLTVNHTTATFGPVHAAADASAIDLTFNLDPSNSVTFTSGGGDAGAGRLGALTVTDGSTFAITSGTLFVSSGNLTASQINLGDTLDVLGGATLNATNGVTGSLVGATSLAVTAGSVSGSYNAGAITVAAPIVAGNYVTGALTVTGATSFNITGSIAGLSNADGAADIVFIGGTAFDTGTFNGLNVNGSVVAATVSGIDIGTDVQSNDTLHIFGPLATALANPNEPLGVGASAAPAAGGPATAEELNAIAPAAGGEEDTDEAHAKAKKKRAEKGGLAAYDYVNRFLDGTLDRH